MVHSRELKKIEREIENQIELTSFEPLHVSTSLNLKEIKLANPTFISGKDSDLSEVIVNKNEIMSIGNGSGNIKIILKNNSNLVLNLNEKLKFLNLEIESEEDNTNEVFLSTNSPDLNCVVNVNLNENSKLKIISHIFSVKTMRKEINLKNNSNFSLYENFHIKNEYSFIQNKIIHLEESSSSNFESTGCVQDQGHVINDGIIQIKNKAKFSSGHQSLRNIILDDKSKIFSEPILEIDNNQVSCSHGCTISDIDKNTLYYIQTRGLNIEEGRELVISSLFNSTIHLLNENLKQLLNIET